VWCECYSTQHVRLPARAQCCLHILYKCSTTQSSSCSDYTPPLKVSSTARTHSTIKVGTAALFDHWLPARMSAQWIAVALITCFRGLVYSVMMMRILADSFSRFLSYCNKHSLETITETVVKTNIGIIAKHCSVYMHSKQASRVHI
jgi:hypothetical protein